MSFEKLYDFLELLQKNNSKEWMDSNRVYYQEVKVFYVDWLTTMNDKLAAVDPNYFDTPGKKAINRINNNLMFHPNRPIYKDHFGAGLDQKSKEGDFYIELGAYSSFIGGGYWHPSTKTLRSIREAIDYNGEVLKEIIEKKSFKDRFGGLVEDNSLKTGPKGYSKEHKHIDLLKRRSFAVTTPITKAAVCAPNFDDLVIEIYKDMLPFRRYLNKAVTV